MSSTITVDSTAAAVEAPPSKLLVSPEDRIWTIDELIRRRASELEDAPLIAYPNTGLLDFEEHSARSVDHYANAAAEKLQSLGLKPVDPKLEKPPVIGMVAQSGLHVIITIIALNRLGYSTFLISTRLACPALVQLLTLADCRTVLTTPTYEPVLAEVAKERDTVTLPMIMHSDYYGKTAPRVTRAYDPESEAKKVAVIIHSSGSTGLPKPIYLTNYSVVSSAAVHMNMRALLTSPLFHSHGFYEVFRSIYSKKPLYIFNYALPLTNQNVVKAVKYVKPEIFHTVPYVIKMVAESEEGIQTLTNIKLILYGGSSFPEDLGHQLVRRGVFLAANYGVTESGRLMTSNRPQGDMDWDYLRMVPVAAPYVLMDEIAPGIHECVALAGLPSKSTTNSDDPPGSFRTRDLFEPHKTRPGLWKYICRLDDRFTLVNAEKVLPIPMEGRIRQEEFVKEAVVFGEGRNFPGVLIMKADKAADWSDEEFLDKVWPAVEAANSKAETFSHIPRELVVTVPAGTKYPQTDKGTFIRVPTYHQFAKEIDAAYENFENGIDGKLRLSGQELEDFLARRLNEKFGFELTPDADFFAAGVNSLQCIQMWNVIRTELALDGMQAGIGQNILYETGNIRELARHLQALRDREVVSKEDELKAMRDLIEKYSTFQPHKSGTASQPEKEVVLLTGATGGLGAHLLRQMVSRPNVVSVWALVRASSDAEAMERVLGSLKTRGIELSPEERSKVVAVACDLSLPDLGFDSPKLEDLKSSLTAVIHSAWAVNFNISVQSFESHHIGGTHNLIQLCLSVKTPSPARFFFCSSVAAGGGTPRPGTVAEGPVALPEHAQGHGYGRSKFVAEHITLNSARRVGAPARVLRIGQLIGDTRVGEWNTTEGVPMMIQTAVTLGALPMLDEEMSWLPVDYAAKIILELTKISSDQSSSQSLEQADPELVYHILNPKRFHWTRDMLPSLSKAGLDFQILPTADWMEKLRTSDKDPAKNPPIKLLGWFEGKYGGEASSRQAKVLAYETEASQRDSKSLREVPDVTNVQYIGLVIERLRRHWESA